MVKKKNRLPDAAEMDIHQRIKMARAIKGMTFKDVALKMGKRENYRQVIYKWEKQGVKPAYDSLVSLAKALEVSISWLVDGVDK